MTTTISFSLALASLCGALGICQVHCLLWEQCPGALEMVKL